MGRHSAFGGPTSARRTPGAALRTLAVDLVNRTIDVQEETDFSKLDPAVVVSCHTLALRGAARTSTTACSALAGRVVPSCSGWT